MKDIELVEKEQMDQLDLFSTSGKTSVPFLNIIKDGSPVQMGIKELFDPSVYDEIKAVTFVSSPRFFFETTNQFKKVKLIVGIEDNQVLSSFATGLQDLLDPQSKVEFWNSLEIKTKEKFKNNFYSIRYGQKGISIHSKFYLLKGKKETRIIIDSANFTENAFVSKKQFEEIVVYDNNSLYELYLKRFSDILGYTKDYIPDRIKYTSPKEVLLINDPDLIKDVILDEVEKNRKVIYVTEQVMQEINSAPEKMETDKQKKVQIKELTEILLKKVKNSNQYTFKSSAEIKKKMNAIKAIVTKTNQKSEELDTRSVIYYSDQDHHLYKKEPQKENEGQIGLEDKQALTKLFSSKVDQVDKIKNNLQNINNFVDAYRKFTITKNVGVQSRIFEIILFGFMSPYLWKIREHFSREEGRDNTRSSFPPFLIIAGRASSGKTTVLEFLGTLLGNSTRYMSYESISTKNVIYDYFHSSNLIPILTDEISTNFFTSKAQDKGERLIKYVSNELKGQHPVLIGTTNATGFDVPHQIKRRIYYLEVNNTFKNSMSQESNSYLNQIMNHVDTTLFQDFSYRMGEFIRNEEEFYNTNDFLYVARTIFKNYYNMCEMDLPEWFPETLFDDYRERGRFIWKNLYESHKNHFFDREDNNIFVDIDQFSDNRDKRSKINYLPTECVKEDNQVLILNKEEFYRYININKSNSSIFNALKRSLQKLR